MATVAAHMAAMRQVRWAEVLRRCLAAGCAALVFALGIFAASPALHQQLHHDNASLPMGDECAVVLFSSGVSAPVVLAAPEPPSSEWRATFTVATEDIFVGLPRYLLQPERGPPLA